MANTLISYWDLIDSRNQFRGAHVNNRSGLHAYDTPGHKFFKLFFYFYNGTGDDEWGADDNHGGLLEPTWLKMATAESEYATASNYTYEQFLEHKYGASYASNPNRLPNADDQAEYEQAKQQKNQAAEKQYEKQVLSQYHHFNSAWAYFRMNGDAGRAHVLQKFVNLLSSISSDVPWYFSEITGLESAMDRKTATTENFAILQERPKISIKCLPDAVDDRIGTLLDMYRYIVWDWVNKREALPANLRKFDMGILIFETPTANTNVSYINEKNSTSIPNHQNRAYFKNIGSMNPGYNASMKYIELHNCEIDYNSTKIPYSMLNNKEGLAQEYCIDISFDDCFESRYNEFLQMEFGDLLNILSHNAEGTLSPEYLWALLPDVWEEKNEPDKYNYGFFERYAAATGIDNQKYGTRILTPQDWYEISNGETKALTTSKLSFTELTPYQALISEKPDKNKPWKTSREAQSKELKNQGWGGKLLSNAIDYGAKWVNSTIKKAVLGNLYTFSLSNIGDVVKGALAGDVMGVAAAAMKYYNQTKNLADNKLGSLLDITDNFNNIVEPVTGLDITGNWKTKKHTFPTAEDKIGQLNENRYQGKAYQAQENESYAFQKTPDGLEGYQTKKYIAGTKEAYAFDNDSATNSTTGKKIESAKLEYKEHIGQILQDDTLVAQTKFGRKMGQIPSKKIIKPVVKKIGNLAQGNTIADNL